MLAPRSHISRISAGVADWRCSLASCAIEVEEFDGVRERREELRAEVDRQAQLINADADVRPLSGNTEHFSTTPPNTPIEFR